LDNSPITPLIYKKYIVEQTKIKTNNRFRQQLFQSLKCEGISDKRFEYLSYSQSSLMSLFEDYGKCKNISLKSTSAKAKKGSFNLSVRPRLEFYSKLDISTYINNPFRTTLDSKIGYGIGLDLEYVLPYNRNKWGISLEPNIISYKNSGSDFTTFFGTNNTPIDVSVTKTVINVPIGLRHYFFLNEKSNLFIALYAVFQINLESDINFFTRNGLNPGSYSDDSVEGSLQFGIGYKLMDKFSLEARYNGNTNIIRIYDGDVTTRFLGGVTSLVLGYRLF